MQAYHLADVLAEVLRPFHLTAVAEGDIEEAVTVEYQARAEVLVAADLWCLAEDHFAVGQLHALEFGAHDLGAAAAFALGGIAQVEPAVLRIARVQGDIEQTTLAAIDHSGHAADGLRQQFTVLDHAQLAGFFRDQQTTVRQERHAPGFVQAFDHGLQMDLAAGGRRSLCCVSRLLQ
jgi:hypothetical protein